MTDKVKAQLQELCPDVMELKEGCQVSVGHKNLVHTVYGYEADEGLFFAYLNKPYAKELQANSFYDIQFAIGEDEVEILGSPITLTVMLRAIQKLKFDYAVMIDQEGGFVTALAGQPPRLFSVFKGWNLEHDDYDQQSEECKQFIGSLLGV